MLSPCLFNLYAEYILWKDGLVDSQARIKTSGRNINNLRYAGDITLMAQNTEELESFLIGVKEVSEQAGLKLNTQRQRSWHPALSLQGR